MGMVALAGIGLFRWFSWERSAGSIVHWRHRRQASSHILIGVHPFNRANKKDLGTPRSFFSADQPSRCLEINREISTIDVFPVNSNLTFPNDEK